MPSLHSRQGHSLRLLGSCERDEVCVTVDIYTLVRELRDKVDKCNSRKSQDSRELTMKVNFKTFSHHKRYSLKGKRKYESLKVFKFTDSKM